MPNRLNAFGLFGGVNDARSRQGIVPSNLQNTGGNLTGRAGQAANFALAQQAQQQAEAQRVSQAPSLAASYGPQVQSGIQQAQDEYFRGISQAEQEQRDALAREQHRAQLERDRLSYSPAYVQAGSSVPGQYRPSATYNALGQQLSSTPSTGMELYDRAVGGDANAGAIIMADYNRRGLETPYEAQLAVMNQQSRTPSLRTTGSRGSVARQTGQTGTGGRLGGWGGRRKWGGA